MNVINLVKNILLQTQFFVSLCATFLGIFIFTEQQSYHFSIVVILFMTFWNGYIFTVYHYKKNTIIINSVGFILISFLIFKFLNFQFYCKWLIVLFLGFIYNADFFKINLREFFLIKTFYVGFVWAITLVWLPLEELNLIWFFIIFLFVSGITFPFEIRDVEKDRFPTLPQRIGIQNTKFLSYLFLFVSTALAIQNIKFDFAIAFFCTTAIAYLLIYFSNPKRKDWYYSFLMESLSVLPFLIYFILNLKN